MSRNARHAKKEDMITQMLKPLTKKMNRIMKKDNQKITRKDMKREFTKI